MKGDEGFLSFQPSLFAGVTMKGSKQRMQQPCVSVITSIG